MTRCVLCQAREVAGLKGTEVGLLLELYRQLPANRQVQVVNQMLRGLAASPVTEEGDVVSREEHERVVERLNARIAFLTGRRRKAS